MIKIKLNLAQLKSAVREIPSKDGGKIKVLILPIAENSLFLSEKGNVYLDLVAHEVAPEKRKSEDTHIVVQSFDKDTREKMKTEGTQSPIIGNARVSVAYDPQPAQSAQIPESTGEDFENDLPF